MTCFRMCATGLPVEKGEVIESALEVSDLKKMLFLVSACFKTSKNLVGSSKMSQKESKDNLPDYLIFFQIT